MPLYNFDPAEEGEDWESELLEEDKEQQVALHIRVSTETPGGDIKYYLDKNFLSDKVLD